MSTCGSTLAVKDHKTERRVINNGNVTRTAFNYTIPFSYHYLYRHQIDDHNQRRHSSDSIEQGMKFMEWSKRVFTFIIGVTEVNAYKMKEYLSGGSFKMTEIEFRRSLALQMVENRFDEGYTNHHESDNDEEDPSEQHLLLTKPNFTGKWTGDGWAPSAGQYTQQRCSRCKKKTRQYCSCSKLKFYCEICFAIHYHEASSSR